MGIFSEECYGWLKPSEKQEAASSQEDPTMQGGRGAGTTTDFTPFGGGTVLRDGIYVTGKNLLDATVNRRAAVGYSPLRRAVSLIAGSGARIITNGLLRIETSVGAGRVEPTGLEQELLLKIAESVDGGSMASRIFFEDCIADYCMAGNALIGYERNTRGEVGDMQRLRVPGAYTEQTSSGMLYVTYTDEGQREYRSERNVIHCRWPDLEGSFAERTHQFSRRSRRNYPFAQSPILTRGHPLTIAMMAMDAVAQYYATLPPDIAMNLDKEMALKFSFDQMKEMADDSKARYAEAQRILATFGSQTTKLGVTPFDRVPKELLEFILRDVSRIYGVPPILLEEHADRAPGVMVEQMAYHFWKFGLKDHVGRFIDPMSLRLLRKGRRLVVDEMDFLQGNVALKDALVAALGGGQGGRANATEEEVRRMISLPRDRNPDDTEIKSTAIVPSGGGSPERTEERDDDTE